MQERITRGERAQEALNLARDAWRRSWNALRNTPGLLVLSLLLGVSLWVFVTDTENPIRVDVLPSPIQVEAANVADGLAVANQLPPVDIRVAAPEDRWEELSSANFRAVVDLQDLEAREQEVRVDVDVEDISGVRVVDVIPRTVTVNLEPLVRREVPVTSRVLGSLPIGYELGEAQPAQETATVIGPQSLVELVREAVADVNVTGLTVGVEQTVPLSPRGGGGAQIRGVQLDPPNVVVSLAIQQRNLVRTLPLEVRVSGEPASGFRVASVSASPSTVQVEGPIEALQQLDAIALPPVDIAGARSDVVRAVSIPAPSGVALAEDAATVTVSITAALSSMQMQVAPTAENVPPGVIASILQPNVTVVLQGPAPVLNALLPRDLRATVDLGGLAPGQHDRQVNVVAPEGVEVVSVQPQTVSVTLSEP